MPDTDQLTLPFSESQILKARSLMKNKTAYLTVFEKFVNALPVLLLQRKMENIKRHFKTLSLPLLHCTDTTQTYKTQFATSFFSSSLW